MLAMQLDSVDVTESCVVVKGGLPIAKETSYGTDRSESLQVSMNSLNPDVFVIIEPVSQSVALAVRMMLCSPRFDWLFVTISSAVTVSSRSGIKNGWLEVVKVMSLMVHPEGSFSNVTGVV